MVSSKATIEEASWQVVTWAAALAHALATDRPSSVTTNSTGVKDCGHSSDRQCLGGFQYPGLVQKRFLNTSQIQRGTGGDKGALRQSELNTRGLDRKFWNQRK